MSAYLSSLTPVANHLWQSTVCVGVVWLLALALKKNRAAIRYWLWFAASVKFLVPFSLLVALGSQLSWRTAAPVAQTQWSLVVDNAIQPFVASTAPTQLVSRHDSLFTLTFILIAIWVCGAAVGTAFWLKCWMQMRRIRKNATKLSLGLSISALSSPSQIEPGVFGIFRPVLLLPQGIESCLTPAQLEAVVAHEMAHVRRRDNLTAAIHMVVEIAFWFFPVVWWLRARLIEERENACDEAVLCMGSEPASYAEGIIEVCKAYAESPATCISGISGSDLKKRVIRIVNRRLGENLTCGKKVGLTLASVVVLVAPLAMGFMTVASAQSSSIQTPRPLPSFEVISVKPDPQSNFMIGSLTPSGLFRSDISTVFLIRFAYNVRDFQIVNAPSWVASKTYAIDAKTDDLQSQKLATMSSDERTEQTRLLLQSLLAQRFGLKIHHETKDAPSFDLIVAKVGRMRESQTDCKSQPRATAAVAPQGVLPAPSCFAVNNPGHIAGLDMPISKLASFLTFDLRQTVTDKTGLPGNYDIILDWTPDPSQSQPPQPGPAVPQPDPNGPSLQAALIDDLGLKLVSTKTPLDSIVIDHIEEPTPN